MNILFMANNGLPRNGLVALYDIGKQIALGNTGQTLVDFSGRGNSAQLGSTAGADTNDPAYSGQGLTFGGDDYVICPTLINANDFTIISIAKVTDATPNNDLVTQFASEQVGRFIFATGGEKLKCYMGGIARVTSVTNIYDNTVYCMGLRRKNDQLNLTVNNVLGAPVTNNTPIYQTATRIGTYGSGEYLIGSVYLTAIYNRALSDTEYTQAYNYLRRLMMSRGVVI